MSEITWLYPTAKLSLKAVESSNQYQLHATKCGVKLLLFLQSAKQTQVKLEYDLTDTTSTRLRKVSKRLYFQPIGEYNVSKM